VQQQQQQVRYDAGAMTAPSNGEKEITDAKAAQCV
jgi:hypothetical protein